MSDPRIKSLRAYIKSIGFDPDDRIYIEKDKSEAGREKRHFTYLDLFTAISTDFKLYTNNVGLDTDGNTTIDFLNELMNYRDSSFTIKGFDITDNGNGTINISSGEVQLRDKSSVAGSKLSIYNVPATENLELTNGEVNRLYVYYNEGSPIITKHITFPNTGGFDYTPIYIIYRNDNVLDIVPLKEFGQDHVNASSRKDFLISGFQHIPGGTQFGETGERYITLTPGSFYLTNVQLFHDAFNTNDGDTFTSIYGTTDNWIRASARTQVNNTHYNVGDGTVEPLTSNRFGTRYLYILLGETPRLIILYGNGNYVKESEAVDEDVPSVLPPELQKYGVSKLIGKIVVKEGYPNIVNFYSNLTGKLSSEIPVDHNGLANLNVGDYQHLTIDEKSKIRRTLSTAAVFYPMGNDPDMIYADLANVDDLHLYNEDGSFTPIVRDENFMVYLDNKHKGARTLIYINATSNILMGADSIVCNDPRYADGYAVALNTGKYILEFISRDSTTDLLNIYGDGVVHPKVIQAACSDKVSDLEVTEKANTFNSPFKFYLTEVRLNLKEAPTGSSFKVDVKVNGVSILSNGITIDVNELTSVTSDTPPIIITPKIENNDIIDIDIVAVGSTNTGKGLEIMLIGN